MSDNSIARTVINGYLISTVKLTGDEEYPEIFKGQIYETLVFEVDANGKVTDRDMNVCVRYATRTEAVIGHDNVVSEWSVTTVI
jgi:hypothetical protein